MHPDPDFEPDPDSPLWPCVEQVQLRDVSLAAMMPNGVGYVKLDAFSEGTGDELARALLRLQAQCITYCITWCITW